MPESLSLSPEAVPSTPVRLTPSTDPRSRGRVKTLIADGTLSERSRAVLSVSSGGDVGRVISVERGETTLGRADECVVRFHDPSLSRLHAKILFAVGEYIFYDCGSTNGSCVNDQPVTSPVALCDGDHLRLGSGTTLRFSMVDANEEEAMRRVYESAARDALTGIANRRSFEERINAEIAFAVRHELPLAVLIVDVDHFKRVNDTHGHLGGDNVLQAVAKALDGSVRAEDMVARYGGEEFAIIARGSDPEGALMMAERLRKQVLATEVEYDGKTICVTVSIGMASLDCCETKDRQTLLATADARLYRAKELGRNRVIGSGAGGSRGVA
jgi:two-component system cell cycle response regulator